MSCGSCPTCIPPVASRPLPFWVLSAPSPPAHQDGSMDYIVDTRHQDRSLPDLPSDLSSDLSTTEADNRQQPWSLDPGS